MSAPREHWLLRVARQAGLHVDNAAQIDARVPPDEAWKALTASCGVSDGDLARHVATSFGPNVADFATSRTRPSS